MTPLGVLLYRKNSLDIAAYVLWLLAPSVVKLACSLRSHNVYRSPSEWPTSKSIVLMPTLE